MHWTPERAFGRFSVATACGVAALVALAACMTAFGPARVLAQTAPLSAPDCDTEADHCRATCFGGGGRSNCLGHCTIEYKTCLQSVQSNAAPPAGAQGAAQGTAQASGTAASGAAPNAGPPAGGSSGGSASWWTLPWHRNAAAPASAQTAPAPIQGAAAPAQGEAAAPPAASAPSQAAADDCDARADQCRSICFGGGARSGCLGHCTIGYKTCMAQAGAAP